MSTAYIDAAYMATIVGQANVDRYFCDDGSGNASAALVNVAINQASAAFDSDVYGSYQDPPARVQLATDDVVKMNLAWCALHFGARRRPEWRDDQGRAPFHVEYAEARKHFKDLQQAKQRSQAEPTAGVNPLVGGNLNSDYAPPTFIFAGTSTKPAGSGGF